MEIEGSYIFTSTFLKKKEERTRISVFISIPLMVKRIPLPKGKELMDKEFGHVCNQVHRLLGPSVKTI